MFSKPTGTSECETKHGVPPRERRRGSESDPSAAAGLGPARGLSTRGSRGWGGEVRVGGVGVENKQQVPLLACSLRG